MTCTEDFGGLTAVVSRICVRLVPDHHQSHIYNDRREVMGNQRKRKMEETRVFCLFVLMIHDCQCINICLCFADDRSENVFFLPP